MSVRTIITVIAFTWLSAGCMANSLAPAVPNSNAGAFEFKMISSPPNRPQIKLNDPLTKGLLVALHAGVPRDELAQAIGGSEADVLSKLDALVGEGLIRKESGVSYSPTFPVITAKDASHAFRVNGEIVAETARLIRRNLGEIKRLYASLPGFRSVSFDDASLLILSNVLLDNWQIGSVEKAVLGKERPKRLGGNYYLALLENSSGGATEALGIYGNQASSLGDINISIYGNRRLSGPPHLLNFTSSDLERDFGFPAGIEPVAGRKVLVEGLIVRWRDPRAALDPAMESGLRKFHLIDENGQTQIPVLSSADDNGLDDLAAFLLPSLVSILNNHLPILQQQYKLSGYDEEGVTFEEFFLWWYHVYYTAVTDRLIADGFIHPPAAGNATYLTIIDPG